ncbi:MAG: hypothetical protein V1739_03420 [Candidatus Omnitrophota bacterium]
MPTDDLMEKIMPLVKKFLGKDAAALLNAYKKGNGDKQKLVPDGQTDEVKFKEFFDEHQWKGLRRSK